MPSATVTEKARRLYNEGCVRRVEDDKPRLFEVQSGARAYRVVVGRHMAWCDCPAGERAGECSHITAARLALEADA